MGAMAWVGQNGVGWPGEGMFHRNTLFPGNNSWLVDHPKTRLAPPQTPPNVP